MKSIKKAVYFFCNDLNKDPVAYNVFKFCRNLFNLKETDIIIDGNSVLEYVDANSNIYQYVRTNEVLSHNYSRYLPMLTKYFNEFDFAGVVNWHEGTNAPDKVLTVHTTGDVPTGIFGKTNPLYFKNLVNAIETNRKKFSLGEFTTFTEATHWSGTMYGSQSELLAKYTTPIVDIEIGSTSESWMNEAAIKILAISLTEVFYNSELTYNLICVGGIHFEEAFRQVMINSNFPISIGHILPNQWIVNNYDENFGIQSLEKCISTVQGNVHGIVYHDNLKGIYKQQCRTIGEKYKIPVFKHKLLKDMKKVESIIKESIK